VHIDWRDTALLALAISLLNLLVYLNTLVLLGSINTLQSNSPQFVIGSFYFVHILITKFIHYKAN
jgi:arginine exporter protein ArgO